jgi:hypothetical protein
MLKLLPLDAATYRRFPRPVCFHDWKQTSCLKSLGAGRRFYTKYEQRTMVGLLNGQVTVARWRLLSPISASDPFSQLEKALITQK